eukprot:scaffold285_cov330-Pavlova_lutheri.AAC.21
MDPQMGWNVSVWETPVGCETHLLATRVGVVRIDRSEWSHSQVETVVSACSKRASASSNMGLHSNGPRRSVGEEIDASASWRVSIGKSMRTNGSTITIIVACVNGLACFSTSSSHDNPLHSMALPCNDTGQT